MTESQWPTVAVHHGDAIEELRKFPAATFHSCVVDPPYHLTGTAGGSVGFMGAAWDGGDIAFRPETWVEVLRVLKPGAHLAAFSSPRTVHRMTCAIEDAGFEIRDQLLFLFGTGFPKGLDVAKAIDKRRHDRDDVLEVCRWVRERRDAAGITNGDIDAAFGFNGMAGHWTSVGTQPAVPTLDQVPALFALLRCDPLTDIPPRIRELLIELNGRKGEFGAAWHARDVTGTLEEWTDRQNYAMTNRDGLRRDRAHSDDARTWEGWNTNLKPSYEPIVLARAPLPNGWTVADCVLAHGTGAINIQACRIETGGGQPFGRWPPNVILDADAAVMLDRQAPDAGGQGIASGPSRTGHRDAERTFGSREGTLATPPFYGDTGGASRFFYTAKASREERDAGLSSFTPAKRDVSRDSSQPSMNDGEGNPYNRGVVPVLNSHPTVKPLDLMRWVCRLITPLGGRILDPFVGSGSTLAAAALEGFGGDGIEKDPAFVTIARARAEHWRAEAIRLAEGGARPPAESHPAQLDIF